MGVEAISHDGVLKEVEVKGELIVNELTPVTQKGKIVLFVEVEAISRVGVLRGVEVKG